MCSLNAKGYATSSQWIRGYISVIQASATYGTRVTRKIFTGTLSELKYSNYDIIKKLKF
jgi:hypothetical protein